MSMIIRADGLAKRYSSRGGGSYVALRDELGGYLRNLKVHLSGGVTGAIGSGMTLAQDFWALRNITFELHAGERLGIIGRNGAGKSTLLKLLTRVTYPTLGTLAVKGRVASLLEVGIGFHPELTGRENIYLSGLLLGVSKLEVHNRFDEIVHFSELETFVDVPVKRYSSGMYVRLAFAVAVHLKADVIVLDEVLAVGDAAYQRKCVDKIESLCRSGTTLILVSHNLRLLSQLCNRALLLHEGAIVLEGKMSDVLKRYGDSLRSQLSLQGARVEFPTSQEKSAQILSVSLRDTSGEERVLFRENERLQVEFEFELRRDFPTLSYSLQLWTSDSSLVLASLDSDEQNVPNAIRDTFPRKRGRYLARVEVPTNRLNPGIYEIELVITPGPARLDTCRGLYFEVAEALPATVHSPGIDDTGILRAPLEWYLTSNG